MAKAKATGQGNEGNVPQGKQGRQGKEAAGGGQFALAVGGGIVVGIALLAVIGAGFALSFEATREVAEASRISHSVSAFLPVIIDGAMMIATVVAIVLRRLGQPSGYPLAVVITGTALSVAINGVHATGSASTGAAVLALSATVRCAVSAIPGFMLALSVHLAAVFLDGVSSVTRVAPHATHATDATPRRVQRVAPVAPREAAPAVASPELAEVASAAESAPPVEAPQVKAEATTEAGPAPEPQGTDELRARREEHAFEALRTWWLTAEAKEEIGARRGNDGFPNRAEAKRVCKASSDLADRARARLRDEYSTAEASREASQ